jgi:hypothetical protein
MDTETTTIINPSIEMSRETEKTVEITLEDKERFFKSILADRPYEEVVSLFDGQLKVRLRSMTVQENSDVVNQIVADRKNGVAAENDAYLITISTYRLALSLVSIDDQPYSTITKDNFQALAEKDTYVLARARPMSAWGTSKLAIFLDAFKAFEYKTIRLTSEVQTPNFWKAST